MRQLPSWASGTIIAVVAVAAVYFLNVSTTPSEERGLNHPAPPVAGTLTTGQPVQLSDYKGKVVLINFWGTWCPPCRQELPDLINLQKKYQNRGFTVLGLAENRDPRLDEAGYRTALNGFNAKAGINYPNLPVPEGTKEAYGIEAFPTSLLVDRNGVVVKAWVGPADPAVAAKLIEDIL